MKKILLALAAVALMAACQPNPWKDFTNLPEGMDPVTVGNRIAEQFLSTEPEYYHPVGFESEYGHHQYVHYSVTSLWTNSLEFARLTGNKELEQRLIDLFEPFYTAKRPLQNRDNHVDHSIFGATPLEIYLLNGDVRALQLGLRYADHQWAEPDTTAIPGGAQNPGYQYWKEGYTDQTRLWIDDMYMINLLQTQAYRATGREEYITRAAKEMVLYLDKLQNPDGLFYHSTDAPFIWGRGDGWMAAGMPIVLKYLPEDSEYYAPILEGYRKMMASLLHYQHESGLWGQLVDDPDIWDESSCSAMFAYGFLEGIQHGWLDRKAYGPAARKAWIALCGRLDEHANLAEVCVGTGRLNNHDYYVNRPRYNGDSHGQAPMMWICRILNEK